MQVEIITPDKLLFSGEAERVQLPGSKGSFEVLKNHAPIISLLDKGNVRIMDAKNNPQFFEIKGGVVEVMNNKVIILAD